MSLQRVPYSIQVDHDGRKYQVTVPDLLLPKCSNCGEIALDEQASRDIDTAFRRVAGLLSPEEIREGRTRLGLNQQAFADQLGIAVSTLSRWENGVQVQQRVMDRILRAFFDVAPLREYLRNLLGVEAANVVKPWSGV